jgi:predicted aconitase
VRLTPEEERMWSGEEGPAVQKAMRIVVALADIYEAADLVPVGSVQVSGVSYKNLGDAGLDFLREWGAQGARVRVPAFMNPAGMDLKRWQEMGIRPGFAEKQRQVVAALAGMGVAETCTCTPYLVGHRPALGEHVAWAESSAVSYANSVLGARTNREGGPSALAAAITGRTACYGLHLDAPRWATHLIEVGCALESEADYGALGYWVGVHIGDSVPWFRLRSTGQAPPAQEQLMALGAAMAASGAVALYHVEGVTPEAQDAGALPANVERWEVDDLSGARVALNSPLEQIDLVTLGCPHSTLADLERAAAFLDGRKVVAALWITTSRGVRAEAEQRGWVAAIEKAGGRVWADTCLVVAPVEEMGYHGMATNSAKAATYSPTHARLPRRFGTLEQCLQAALSGSWEG